MTEVRKVSDETEVKEAESLIFKDYIEKEYDHIGIVNIWHPKMEEDAKISDYNSNKVNYLLKETELPTLIELENILEERGTWGQKEEDKIEELNNQIKDKYKEIDKYKSQLDKKGVKNKEAIKKNIEKAQSDVINIVQKQNRIISRKNYLFEGTVERRAENETLKFKIVTCVRDLKDKPIWKSVNEFNKLSDKVVQPLVLDCIRFWAGISDPLFAKSLDQAFGSSVTEQQ